MNDNVVFHYKLLFPEAFPILDELRKGGTLCDVTLITEHCSIFAHKVVLAATSKYFFKIFTVSPNESRQSEVYMKNIDSETLKSLINFMYTGSIKISFSNFQLLMIGASLLKLNHIRDACAQFLIERLHPSNVIEIRQFGKKMTCQCLVDACDTFINDNFGETSMSKSFVTILSSEEVEKIFKRDELYVESEETIFEAAMRWVSHDHLVRTSTLPKLLASVRLPLLTPQYLTDKVSTNELIKKSHACRDLLDEARDYHLMPERFLFGSRIKPRRRSMARDTMFKVIYLCILLTLLWVEYTFSTFSNIASSVFNIEISHWWRDLYNGFEEIFNSETITIHIGIIFISLITYFCWKQSEINETEGKQSLTRNLEKFIHPGGDIKTPIIEKETNIEDFTSRVVAVCEQANAALKWMLRIAKYEYKSL